MKITFDLDRLEVSTTEGNNYPMYSDYAFDLIKDLWLKVGWNQKYNYTFSWLGAPIIQLPDDMIRYQEVVYALQPDIIIETGIAHGGSLIFSASLCRLLGRGRVVGIDIEIRPHNRQRMETHTLADLITLIEGSSTAPEIVARARAQVQPNDRVLVVLDSNHSYDHVTSELRSYAPLVSVGSYIVATDGLMRDLAQAPRGQPNWERNNPATAAKDFVAANSDFVIEEPVWPFNESNITGNVTHWPDAWIKRIR
ncbi:cephalosporin hydroxylase family protein [Bradyrhizobium sp. 138]|uniref:cephalosporin hydroxylase family protein n=1 Tax=Bradyrhizobium sp. 138 TaxID=2782615 RepID=UPI001FF8C0AE|nr:CmcI family methyltransferase [Bradyrhizobium sp. 138]MCK1737083.1 cephalosporin hydroxylase family protein [Bradyrhizobium sp. 138]